MPSSGGNLLATMSASLFSWPVTRQLAEAANATRLMRRALGCIVGGGPSGVVRNDLSDQ